MVLKRLGTSTSSTAGGSSLQSFCLFSSALLLKTISTWPKLVCCRMFSQGFRHDSISKEPVQPPVVGPQHLLKAFQMPRAAAEDVHHFFDLFLQGSTEGAHLLQQLLAHAWDLKLSSSVLDKFVENHLKNTRN